MTDDQQEIARLRDLYAAHFDARDPAAFVSLFADDSCMVVPGGKEISGHERLARLVERTPAGGTHIPVPAEITVDGDAARCCGPYRMERDGSVQTGQYDDVFVRTPEGWRFARRAILPDA